MDVAFFGPVTFDEARRRGAAELLAVEETRGESVYYAGWFHRAEAGSHSASLEQLEAGQVAAAAASINAYDKMVEAGALDPAAVALLARSEAVPSPPIAMRTGLADPVKRALRAAFGSIHRAEGVTPEMILGYGGKKVDRYAVDFDVRVFDEAMKKLAQVTPEVEGEIIDKAGQR